MSHSTHPRPYLAAVSACLCLLAGFFLIPRPLQAGDGAGTSAASPRTAVSRDSEPLPSILAGFDTGLYRIAGEGRQVEALWTGGEVRKIVPISGGGYFLASSGIFRYFTDGSVEERSGGLPIHSFKSLSGGVKSMEKRRIELRDLAVDPADPLSLATATSNGIFLSKDGGISWTSLGFPASSPGAKALAFAPFPGSREKALWFSQPIKGVFVRKILAGSAWTACNQGLPRLSATTMDEISGFVAGPDALYAATTFSGKIFRFDDRTMSFGPVFDARDEYCIIESPVTAGDGAIRYLSADGIHILVPGHNSSGAPAASALDGPAATLVREASDALPEASLNCVSFLQGEKNIALSELWMLHQPAFKPHRQEAEKRDGLYLQTGFVLSPKDRAARFDMLKAKGLGALVVDAKDDSGKLRFKPRAASLQSAGSVADPFDLEEFTKEARARGLYLIARIVVFKDEALWRKSNGRYSIRDAASGAAWQGYRTVHKDAQSAPERKAIGEYWVDPYSEEVWKYNVDIADEMISRGFDEIQFDYIRFPTDGENLDKAVYSWADPGMDAESALISFLAYARENIDAPISVDIYGSNGWYRSGIKTGQDVELFSRYVDAICPMFYPSHFEQGFQADPPAADRPYRIYRMGSLRNRHFARGAAIIRPWVQSFYLDVSYDREYYNAEYVRKEVLGIRDSTADGMTFWNNVGRYDEVPAGLPSH